MLALAGAPPLSLWATKDEILAAVRESSTALAAVTLAAAAVSAAYAGKVLFVIWARPTIDHPAGDIETGFDAEEPGTRRIPRTAQAALVPLTVGAAALGVLALPPLAPAFAAALGRPAEPQSTPAELVASGVLALLVLAAVHRWGTPAPGWAANWLHLDRAVNALVVHPILRLAAALATFDDSVVDRSVSRAAAGALDGGRWVAGFDDTRVDRTVRRSADLTLRTADQADRLERTGIDAAVRDVAATVERLAREAKRPQTGQLYQYYVQVVVLLLAAVLLLILVT